MSFLKAMTSADDKRILTLWNPSVAYNLLPRFGCALSLATFVWVSANVQGALAGPLSSSVPSTGAVLRQTLTPPAALALPGRVFELPEPANQSSSSTILIPVRKLEIEGNNLIDTNTLAALVQQAEGRELTLGALRDFVDRISQAYRNAGYPVAFAYLPAQSIRDGVIRIAVIEPTYDAIKITGKSRLLSKQAERSVSIGIGDPVALAPLTRSLLLLSQTPGISIKGTLIPGSQPQTTTLQLEPSDLAVFSGNLSLSNYGSSYTGSKLASLAVEANNPFGYGSRLSVNASQSDTGNLKSAGVTLTSPDLGDGLRFGAYGIATEYHLGGVFADLDQIGSAKLAGLNVDYPLILTATKVLNFRLDRVGTWMNQTTRSIATNANQKTSLTRVSLDWLAQDAAKGQRILGQTSALLRLTHGKLSLGTAAELSLDAAGPQTSGHFDLAEIRLGRVQPLPKGFSLTADISAQLSSRNLTSSQKFFLGGSTNIMGLPVGEAAGDSGYLIRLRFAHAINFPQLSGTLIGALLAQHGTVWTNHTVYDGFSGPEKSSAGSLGLGFDYASQGWSISSAVVAPIGAATIIGHEPKVWLEAKVKF
jgi:hemolysin activation/secretion protein